MRARPFAITAGVIVAALGSVVLLGWGVHSAVLVQVRPSFVPMQFNTALGFLLSGLGLSLAAAGRPAGGRMRPLIVACGSVAIAIGLATLIEYAFGLDLGVDQLLWEHYITVKSPHPGRMAPATASSFVLAGIGLVAMVRRRPSVAAVCAAVILTLGAATFVTYLAGYETPFDRSPGATLMAVHTAAGFFVLGAGLLPLALREGASENGGLPRWLPWPVAAVSLTLALLLWQIMVMEQAARVRSAVEVERDGLGTDLEALLETRVNALHRMATRWEDAGGTPRTAWESDAAHYIEHQPGFLTLAWADSSMQTRWSVGAESATDAEVARALDLAFRVERRPALEAARAARRPLIVTDAPLLPSGDGAALMIYFPLFPGGAFDGFILGSVKLAAWANQIGLQADDRGFSFTVSEGERELFGRSDAGRRHERKWGQEMAFSTLGLPWRIRAWPRPELLAQERTRFPEIILAVAIVLALLFPFTVRYAQVARRRAARAEKLNRMLKEDIARRKKVEESLGRTQIGVDCATDPIYWITEDGRILYANEAASESIEYTLDELLRMTVPQIDPDYPPEAWPAHWKEMREAGSLTFQAHHKAKGGRVFPVEITTNFVLDGSGGFIWAYVHDITDRLNAEAERQQAVEALVRTNAELEHFNKMAVGRELRMIELKREVNALLEKDGKPPAYDVSFAPDEKAEP